MSHLVSSTFVMLRHFLSKPPYEEQGTDAQGRCSLIMKYGVSLQTAGTSGQAAGKRNSNVTISVFRDLIIRIHDQCSNPKNDTIILMEISHQYHLES